MGISYENGIGYWSQFDRQCKAYCTAEMNLTVQKRKRMDHGWGTCKDPI